MKYKIFFNINFHLKKSILYYKEPDEKCENRRKLIVRTIRYCGFGCVIHHYAKCFLIALGTNRTLLIDKKTVPEFVQNIFQDGSLFQPISRKCSSFNTESVTGSEWEGTSCLVLLIKMFFSN